MRGKEAGEFTGYSRERGGGYFWKMEGRSREQEGNLALLAAGRKRGRRARIRNDAVLL